jgi:hypothetical protein
VPLEIEMPRRSLERARAWTMPTLADWLAFVCPHFPPAQYVVHSAAEASCVQRSREDIAFWRNCLL